MRRLDAPPRSGLCTDAAIAIRGAGFRVRIGAMMNERDAKGAADSGSRVGQMSRTRRDTRTVQREGRGFHDRGSGGAWRSAREFAFCDWTNAHRREEARSPARAQKSTVRREDRPRQAVNACEHDAQAGPAGAISLAYISPSSSFASSVMRSGLQGGDQTSFTRTSFTPSTAFTASSTWPGSEPATGQAGVVKVISM